MRKNLTVLVLLVTWSLLSTPMLTSTACAGQIPDNLESSPGSSHDDPIVYVNGATDDGTGGDPGDAGDGYGIWDLPDSGGGLSDSSELDSMAIDELLLILQSLLIQLVF